MKNPFMLKSSIPASGTFRGGKTIELVRARTLNITCRLTYNASATVGATVKLYYSPDGTNFDTVPYATFAVNLTAGGTIQETAIIDPPEHGFMRVDVVNGDTTYTVTDVKCWFAIQSHSDIDTHTKGSILKDQGEEDN